MSTYIAIVITPEEGTILPSENIIRERLSSSTIFEAYGLITITRNNDNVCYAILNRDGFAFMNNQFSDILNDRTNFIPLYYFIETRRNKMMKVRLLTGVIETNTGNPVAQPASSPAPLSNSSSSGWRFAQSSSSNLGFGQGLTSGTASGAASGTASNSIFGTGSGVNPFPFRQSSGGGNGNFFGGAGYNP